LKTIEIKDFRGGYFTDIPSELLQDNELLTAENCQWKQGGITKRNGISIYDATDFSAMVGLKGGIRAFINSTWYTIIAIDDDTSVRFYIGTTTTFTEIDAAFVWTKSKNVEFAELLGEVVAVNGTNKPCVIRYVGASVTIENLETYDTRLRNNVNWWAGTYDDGAGTYTDDTVNAQDTGVDDFPLTTVANDANDGCYISCDFTFNYVIFKVANQAAGAPVTVYEYWNGSSWTAITPTTAPVWTDTDGDKVLEFDIPLDSDGILLWKIYSEAETTDGIENRYVLRIRFSTAPTNRFLCDYLVLKHTQYLTQILANGRPHAILSHNGQLFLAERNVVNMCIPYHVTGWREGQVEFFAEGGAKIMQMVSFADTLVVLKEKTIYTYDTNNLMSPVRSRPLTSVGAISERSAVVIGDVLFFVGKDGVYLWDGAKAISVSNHIKTDIDSYTLTNACGIFYNGEYWVGFPTNSIVLTCDPDTFRRGSMGEGRASFYKFTGYKVNQFVYNNGEGDNGILQAIIDQNSPYIARCDLGVTDNITGAAAINMTVETKYISPKFQSIHFWGRLKPKIKQVSAATGAIHTLTLQSEDGTVSVPISIRVSTGSGYYSEDISIPYTLDGKNLSIKLNHNLQTSAGLIGYAFETKERRF